MTRPLVIDTGPLIKAEADDRATLAAVKKVASADGDLLVPAGVLAQAWRGNATQVKLVRFLKGCRVEPLDERRARRVGELCTNSGINDTVDGAVVALAEEVAATILTTDPDDIRQLSDYAHAPIEVVSL